MSAFEEVVRDTTLEKKQAIEDFEATKNALRPCNT
jgi:hypothetical protein